MISVDTWHFQQIFILAFPIYGNILEIFWLYWSIALRNILNFVNFLKLFSIKNCPLLVKKRNIWMQGSLRDFYTYNL